MAISWFNGAEAAILSRCGDNLMLLMHTSTLVRHGSRLDRSGFFRVKARHGGKVDARNPSVRRNLSASKALGIATSASWKVT